MTRAALVCASIFVLAAAATPAPAAAQSTKADCAARIDKLENSTAEGEERLAEKYKVINLCAAQYAHDATIKRLADACAKYAEQPVLKQQFLAECQLAAFKYANALRDLKAEYGK